MPRKKLREPRSLMENSYWSRVSSSSIAKAFEQVMIISSTYIIINIAKSANLNVNREVFDLAPLKPRAINLLLNLENQALGSCYEVCICGEGIVSEKSQGTET
jgi:hypothetical protein